MRTAGVVRGCVALAGLALLAGISPTAAIAQNLDHEGLGHDLGDPEAPVLVVEYADFACGACAQFALDTWPALRTEFVDSGRVRWKVVPFELGFRNSEEGARAAECAADQDHFWPMHDALYRHRDQWVAERNPKDAISALAHSVGVEGDSFLRCYESRAFRGRTASNNDAASEAGVRGTPTFSVNGFLVQGAVPVQAFRAILLSALESPRD